MNTRDILEFIQRERKPVTLRKIIEHFDLDVDERRQLRRWLESEVQDGRLARVKKNLYSTAGARPAANLLTGRLTTHRDGYGFVVIERENLPDVFIPPDNLANAVHGDKVQVQVSRKGRAGRLEGKVVRVLSRSQEQVVGKLFRHRDQWMVTPLDERYHYTIQITGSPDKLHEGQIVNVDIVAQPKRFEPPLGRVEAVLGFPDDPEIQFKIVCYKNQIPMQFPDEVLQEAEAIRAPGRAEIESREDLRDEPIVTIDGETARDFDDAISIERAKDGFLLGVHIADVSHYVTAGQPLDTEAFVRGTSVYFPDRAIPMLPEKLSNNVCSLRPDEDRLTMSVFMEVDSRGNVGRYRFAHSVIRSRARMTYTAVKKIVVDHDPALTQKYRDLAERFEWMLELSRILTAKRKAKGAIDFDLPEAEIEYDVNGEMFDIVRSERNEAHRLIEEFMLLANETVATYLTARDRGMIYRVHEEPDPFKVKEFARLVREFGYSLGPEKEEYSARDFQRLSENFSGKPEERFLSYIMLRSFKQARYSDENLGHFGLATHFYTHFTSPIRRYPDLVVHRLLKQALDNSAGREKWRGMLGEISDQSSERERRADEAEREIMKWLMAVFMSGRLGEEYNGFVSSVRHNGLFIELLDHFVEGFIHVSKMPDDYYFFDERTHRLIGENSGRIFRLGDRVRIVVDKIDRDRHLIDFALAEKAGAETGFKRRKRGRSGSRRRR
ncbi:MAG TPA: ribonuclease R [Acidobacteriota bacterium]|jgi:ribonuclease R